MNINSVDLNLLRVLDSLLKDANVSAAARRLGLSQPAVSGALARLRKIFDDPLLVRSGPTLVRTRLAEELRPNIAALIQEAARLLEFASAFEPSSSSRRFRILANDYASFVLLAPLAARIKSSAPAVLVEVLPFRADFEDSLASRECDLVVGDLWSMRSSAHTEALYSETFLTLARRDHPRIQKKLSLEQFVAEDHVLISEHGRVTGNVDAGLQALGLARRVTFTLPYFLTAPAIVAQTDMLLTLPAQAARKIAKQFALASFAPPLKVDGFDLGFAWDPRSADDHSINWLEGELRAVATTLPRQR